MKEIDFRYDLLPLKNKLFRLALRITLDPVEAEDVTQDTLVRVWTKREELEQVTSLEAYCLTVCRNLSLDRKASKDRQVLSLDETADDPLDASPDPFEQIAHDEKMKRVHALFNQLPVKQREVLQLRDIEGKNVNETAQILGISPENVKVLLHRARTSIREQYLKIENYGL